MYARNAILVIAACIAASLFSCATKERISYTLVRQYPGELPPEEIPGEPSSAAPEKTAKRLRLIPLEGWDDVTGVFPAPEGTVAVFARASSGPAIIAVHGSGTPPGEHMRQTVLRIRDLIEDAKVMVDIEADDPQKGSFRWESGAGSPQAGYVAIRKLKNAPEITFAFIGFGTKSNFDGIKNAVETLADSADIQ